MELIEASHQTSYWRTVVAGIRSRYSGPLLYAANHGNENAVMVRPCACGVSFCLPADRTCVCLIAPAVVGCCGPNRCGRVLLPRTIHSHTEYVTDSPLMNYSTAGIM